MGIHDRPYYREETAPNLTPSWDQRSGVSLIIIGCVAVFLIDAIVTPRNHAVQSFLSLHTSDLKNPSMLWRTISYGFAHSPVQLWHIFFNMTSLWFLGRAVEEKYGRSEFLRIYFASMVCGGILWVLLHNGIGNNYSLCGASGAISCITMLFVLNFPKSILLVFGVIPVQAWLLGVFMIVSNVLGGTPGIESTDGDKVGKIAWDVHLAGIACAAAYFYSGLNFGYLGKPVALYNQMKRRWFGPRLKAYVETEKPISDEEEADRLLDKIHQFGQDSLTSKEKRFLTQYSKAVRERRENSAP